MPPLKERSFTWIYNLSSGFKLRKMQADKHLNRKLIFLIFNFHSRLKITRFYPIELGSSRHNRQVAKRTVTSTCNVKTTY